MKHIKNAKVTAKIQIREGAQIRVLGGTVDVLVTLTLLTFDT